jgi:hypothetical protein
MNYSGGDLFKAKRQFCRDLFSSTASPEVAPALDGSGAWGAWISTTPSCLDTGR